MVKDFTVFYRDIYTVRELCYSLARKVKDRFLMSKIEEKHANLFSSVWLAPDGCRYMAYCRISDSPEYLIDVDELLRYFKDFGSLDLIIDVQRLVVDYVKEAIRPNDIESCIPMSFYERIDDVGYFADMLERTIVRDEKLIEGYIKWRTQSNG